MYSENTVIKLNEIAHRYKDLIHRSIVSVLTDAKIRNTGAGAASVIVDVIDGTVEKAPVIVVTFDDYVLFLDKRKLQWTRLPQMKKLLEWAETKKSNRQEARQLAWAVGWDKRKHDTWKRKSWRRKSLSGLLKEMNKDVLAAYDRVIEQDLEKATQVNT